jgi:hypothetical protein
MNDTKIKIIGKYTLKFENKMTSNFPSNLDDTLNAQYEYTAQMRRSYMYEFIVLFIIAVLVLVITINNLTSDTATTAGQVIGWVILILFVGAAVVYVARWIDGMRLPDVSSNVSNFMPGSGSGPVIRIHYV